MSDLTHDPSPHSDCCTSCGLPIRAWGDVCQASTDDRPTACAEIAAAVEAVVWGGP